MGKVLISKDKMRVEIYALSCPDSGDVRYIGKANDSSKRLKSHIRDSRRRNTPVYCWFRKLHGMGKIPNMQVIAVVEDGKWEDVERQAILEYRAAGARLLNVAEGGNEPFCTAEQRAKNGRANAKSLHEDPKRKRIWALKKGLADSLRFFKKQGMTEAYNRSVAKMHLAAQKAPAVFGEFAAIQYLT